MNRGQRERPLPTLPTTARSASHSISACLPQPLLGSLRQLLVILGNPKHRLLGFGVRYIFGMNARFLGALAPMFRIIDRLCALKLAVR
jgi:hypothetical protein